VDSSRRVAKKCRLEKLSNLLKTGRRDAVSYPVCFQVVDSDPRRLPIPITTPECCSS
jgi:hypothetical protein